MKDYNNFRTKTVVVPIPRSSNKILKNNYENDKPFSYWFSKNRYYHQRVLNFYKTTIPLHARILHINCKNGYLLSGLQAHYGFGIDMDPNVIHDAQKQHPEYTFFCGNVGDVPNIEQIDYIILSFITMEADDIQTLFQDLQRFCHSGTRIIIDSYASFWEPILWITTQLGLRRPTYYKNWVSRSALHRLLPLAGFEPVTYGSHLLCPLYIPLLGYVLNAIVAHIPLINRLCLHQWTIARSTQKLPRLHDATVSIIIPCKNERGNIESAVQRCPSLGSSTELIFVEGNSTDGTLEEIKRVAQLYPHKNISWHVQQGKGKGDAVRLGFTHAYGHVLMILDADLTMPPEELPKFFDALIRGNGECINGSRLVYGMESQAMTFLSWVSNYAFGYLLSWIIGQSITDTLCGTKVLWKQDYEQIQERRHFFGLQDPFGDFDLLFGAAQLHLKIIDMPVHYKQRTYGTTNISRFWDVWFLLWISWRAFLRLKIR